MTEQKKLKALLAGKKFFYQKENDQYVVFIKKAANNIIVPGETHRKMQAAYCRPDGEKVDKICLDNEFPKDYFDEYKNAFGWTREGSVISDEELLNKPINAAASDIIIRKRAEAEARAEEIIREEVEKDAERWRKFADGSIDPFTRALKNFKAPFVDKFKKPLIKSNNSKKWLVVVFSDWQIGALAEERYLVRQIGWNTEKAKLTIAALIKDIVGDIHENNSVYEGVEVLLAGDLNHGLDGATQKGTNLQCDVTRDEQVDALLECLYLAIRSFRDVFPKVNVRAVRGNHDGTDFYPIAKAMSAYFRADRSIRFDISSKRTMHFKVNSTLFILDHGASDIYESSVPKNGKSRESFIQSLILGISKKPIFKEVKQVLFIMGDKHHFEHIEYNDFEFIMVGALPLGDQYADNGNLHSRPRQNCFVIDDNGLRETKHFYIDKYING